MGKLMLNSSIVKASFFVILFMIRETVCGVDSQVVAGRVKVCRVQMGSFTVRRVFV